jgi:hypothetical protein
VFLHPEGVRNPELFPSEERKTSPERDWSSPSASVSSELGSPRSFPAEASQNPPRAAQSVPLPNTVAYAPVIERVRSMKPTCPKLSNLPSEVSMVTPSDEVHCATF